MDKSEISGRQHMTPEDRAECKEIEKDLKVSSRIDEIYDKLANGTPIPTRVGMPITNEYSRWGEFGDGSGYMGRNASESPGGGLPAPESHHMDMDETLQLALAALGPEKAKEILGQTQGPANESLIPKKGKYAAPPVELGPQISKRQWTAIQKFPALIEFLGTSDGEKIARHIAGEMTSLVVDKVGENSRSLSKFAKDCTMEKSNVRQYFKGETWVCRITANGPFRGDEYIYYDKNRDIPKILRRVSEKRYTNVSGEFNIIHEFSEIGSEEIVEADVKPQTSEPEIEEKVDA